MLTLLQCKVSAKSLGEKRNDVFLSFSSISLWECSDEKVIKSSK